MNRPNPIKREQHGGNVGRGLAIQGDAEWRKHQAEGRIHVDSCRGVENCPRCEREARGGR